MNKLRSDSTWAALTPEQKQKLIQWLFEEKLSYEQTLESVQTEFGITASRSSLANYYQTLVHERLREDLCEAQETAAEAQGAEVKLSTLRGAALKMIGKKLIDCSVEPGVAKELYGLTNLMLQSGQQEIQREWLALARERFEFKASTAVLKALPLANEMKAEEHARETARMNAIKQKLFGRELPYMLE
jgi:hypothetical protein